jgi:alpha-N-acetylglucosaminidase
MRKKLNRINRILVLLQLFLCSSITFYSCESGNQPAVEVIERTFGKEAAQIFEFNLMPKSEKDWYVIETENNKVVLNANSQIALVRAAYDYLKTNTQSIHTWSGTAIDIPKKITSFYKDVKTPYKYRYYMNTVTHGYTSPYWDWTRWEKELDWMAIHGLNMPLISGAHEAILYRVFKKAGFKEKDINNYYTGPAHFPWNRMGNVVKWDGDIPKSYFKKQLALTHKIIKRVKELGMHPIVHAFAGFVPNNIPSKYADEKVRNLSWGGFSKKYQANILEPGSKLFIELGKLYVQEWEKEFGKNKFYLADSFNEMDVPLSNNKKQALSELSEYGYSVYKSIMKANKDAVWVMQGWTFPYQKKDGKLFWTPDRLKALLSKVPNDKLLILDLANEYNRLWWGIDPSWKMYDGFFGKQWIYSFIPNMGGKTALNGRLDLYASMPFEALNYKKKGNLVGYGFAPEGIENNEIIYELLSDIAWTDQEFDLEIWVKKYCINRYGAYPKEMKKAFDLFRKSCFGSFTDHPRNKYQFRPTNKHGGSINTSIKFIEGTELFLKSQSKIKNKELFTIDAIEFAVQAIGLKVDKLLTNYQKNKSIKDYKQAMSLLMKIDKLLESHPTWRLENWLNYAQKWGDTSEEKKYYRSNAKRLITTWGGGVNEYAAKTWSGLIRDYYVPRWKNFVELNDKFDLLEWEEDWIKNSEPSEVKAYENPLMEVNKILSQLNNK